MSSQYRPTPRFCHFGRSLKLTPCWNSNSFFWATESPAHSRRRLSSLCPPCEASSSSERSGRCGGHPRCASGSSRPPGRRWGSCEMRQSKRGHLTEQQGELGAGLAGQDRGHLRSFRRTGLLQGRTAARSRRSGCSRRRPGIRTSSSARRSPAIRSRNRSSNGASNWWISFVSRVKLRRPGGRPCTCRAARIVGAVSNTRIRPSSSSNFISPPLNHKTIFTQRDIKQLIKALVQGGPL